MKLNLSTCVSTNLTLHLPDTYSGASLDAIKEAINNDEATILSVEYAVPNEVLSTACWDMDTSNTDLDIDVSPLTADDTTALNTGTPTICYYS